MEESSARRYPQTDERDEPKTSTPHSRVVRAHVLGGSKALPTSMKRPRDERRLYHDLAWTWPIVSPPGRYVREARAIRRLIRGRAPAANTLLHFGGGGGASH